MTLDEIKELIEFIRQHDLYEFELEQDGVKLRVKSGSGHHLLAAPAMPPVMMAAPAVSAPAAPGALVGSQPGGDDTAGEGTELAIVKSPIVGTFYRAAEPGAKPFVEPGDGVKQGDVLCVIEAMKLMNEIDCEYDGEIVSVHVENGQPVQYGERLFAIRLKS